MFLTVLILERKILINRNSWKEVIQCLIIIHVKVEALEMRCEERRQRIAEPISFRGKRLHERPEAELFE